MLGVAKSIIKFFLYTIINILIKPAKEIQKGTLLLIRLDEIGDYILFRNFIKVLKEDQKYKNYRITLLGNSIWRDLSEKLDRDFITEFIWIEKKKFIRNPLYRFRMLQKIASTGYEVIISPVYSRDFYVTDTIVRLVNAKEKIGSEGDLSNIKKWQKKISDRFYTKLIPAKKEIMFEFYRNKEFFENLLEKELEIKAPFIELDGKDVKNMKVLNEFQISNKYAVLFIGGSSQKRKWSIEGFAKIAESLNSLYGYEIVLCGGPQEIEDAKKFEKLYTKKFINLVGKTTLLDLLQILANCDILISNETSAPHLAVAVGTPKIVVISNGNHFGRFIPYPKEIFSNYYPVYHPEIQKNLDDYKKLSNSYGYGSKLDINEITVEMVMNKIDEALNKSLGR